MNSKLNQTVFLIQYSVANRAESEDITAVFSTIEKARKMMKNSIKESMRDNFWWDNEFKKVAEDYTVNSGENHFIVYENGNFDYEHESWLIVEQELDFWQNNQTHCLLQAADEDNEKYLDEWFNTNNQTVNDTMEM